MKKNDRKRAIAEDLYITNGETLKTIAEMVGVSENTVGSWAKKFNWKERRMNLATAPHKIKEALLEQLESVVKGEKPIFNSDDIAKITRALERVDKKISNQMIISVMKDFDSYLLSIDIDHELLDKCLDLHKKFIHHRISNND
jgi:transposase